MEILMIRGDTKVIKFKRANQKKEIITKKPEKMFFTVKESYYSENFLFQKRLNETIIYDEINNQYSFTIYPEDTDNLDYGTYVFDIEIINDKNDKDVQTILLGKLKILEEVTFAENR